MVKQKRHRIVLTVLFDKPCSRAEAAAAVRDSIHGEYYPTPRHETSPEVFKVRAVKPARLSDD